MQGKKPRCKFIQQNLSSVFISCVDSLDWQNQGPEHLINQVLNNPDLRNGSILLFHNGAKYTPQVLDTIIRGLKEKGYQFVPISELIHKENFRIDHTGRQFPN